MRMYVCDALGLKFLTDWTIILAMCCTCTFFWCIKGIAMHVVLENITLTLGCWKDARRGFILLGVPLLKYVFLLANRIRKNFSCALVEHKIAY